MYMQYVRKFSVNQDTSSCQISFPKTSSYTYCTISGSRPINQIYWFSKQIFRQTTMRVKLNFFLFSFAPQHEEEEEVAMTRCLNHMPWLEDNRKTIPGVKSIREKCGDGGGVALMTQSAKGLSTTMATRDNKSSSSSRMMWGRDGTRTGTGREASTVAICRSFSRHKNRINGTDNGKNAQLAERVK